MKIYGFELVKDGHQTKNFIAAMDEYFEDIDKLLFGSIRKLEYRYNKSIDLIGNNVEK